MGPACLTGADGFLNSPAGVCETDLLSAGVELKLGWDTRIVLERSEVKPAGADGLPSIPSSSGSSDIVSNGKPSRSRLDVLDLKLRGGDGDGPTSRPLNQLSTRLSSLSLKRDLLD